MVSSKTSQTRPLVICVQPANRVVTPMAQRATAAGQRSPLKVTLIVRTTIQARILT